MTTKEPCTRCGKETPYHPATPITVRLYYIEGAGQLCEACWGKVYGSKEGTEDTKKAKETKETNQPC